MRVFTHSRSDATSVPRPPSGHGLGEIVVVLRRCMYGNVEVVDTEAAPFGRTAVAGRRPRSEREPWRERIVSVRLELHPDEIDNIAVVSDSGERVGQVDPVRAVRMAPTIDRILRNVAATRACRGCAVDVRCSTFVYAEWDSPADVETGSGPHGPSLFEMTLLVDDGDLGFKISPPEIIVHW